MATTSLQTYHTVLGLLTRSLYPLQLRVLFSLIIVLTAILPPHIVLPYLPFFPHDKLFVYWFILVLCLHEVDPFTPFLSILPACHANMKSYNISNAYLVCSLDSHLMLCCEFLVLESLELLIESEYG